jgi:hypothetical protein
MRMYGIDFRCQPGSTGRHFSRRWAFMFPTLALWLPFEVFDGVRDVHLVARDTGFHQRFIKQPAGGAHKGMPLQILLIAGLLADEDKLCMRSAFSKDGLSGPLVQIAAGASRGSLS